MLEDQRHFISKQIGRLTGHYNCLSKQIGEISGQLTELTQQLQDNIVSNVDIKSHIDNNDFPFPCLNILEFERLEDKIKTDGDFCKKMVNGQHFLLIAQSF